jgi:hypothetical protein
MARRNLTSRIDEELIEMIEIQAKKSGVSKNQYIEGIFATMFKAQGHIPIGWMPEETPRGRKPKVNRQLKQKGAIDE